MSVSYEELPFGLTWVVDEPMRRTSHALADDGRVWFVDPVAEPEALERARALGEVAGVLQLLDRHGRDCAAVARELGVPLSVVPDELPGTAFECIPVVRRWRWRETALWWPDQRALVVPEAVGTTRVFTGGAGPVGVHLLLRVTPPGRLRAYEPQHLLVGHGHGVHGRTAADGLTRTLDHSWRDLPKAMLAVPSALRDHPTTPRRPRGPARGAHRHR